MSDGTVRAWGKNDVGQLAGATSAFSQFPPVEIPNLNNVTALETPSVGAHALAAKSDGSVWAWGLNVNGQLGDGTKTNQSMPVVVPGINAVVFACGEGFSVALKSDHTILDWGYNGAGQLGDGTTNDRSAPAQVTDVSGISWIAAGSSHVLALKSDFTLLTWGYNGEGQLGLGDQVIAQHKPTQIPSPNNVLTIAAGYNHSVVVRKDGTVWSWGTNTSGQLGIGTTSARSYNPVQANSITNAVTVSASYGHTLALASDGTVWAWGSNAAGELGDGTKETRPAPTPVNGLSDVAAISAGGGFSLALKKDGTVWAWGAGPMVNGASVDSGTPGLLVL